MPDMVTLTTFDNSLEAHIVKGLLESEEIPVFLLGEHFFNAQSLLNVGLAQIRLQVPRQQLTEAKQVLSSLKNGDFEQPLIAEFKLVPVACHKCGCTETTQALSYSSIATSAILALYFIGVVVKPIKHSICKQCKTRTE
jgi:hypothetical protein